MGKLRECPFCGGEAELVGQGRAPECFVRCKCDLMSNFEEGAVSKWNTRPIEDSLKKEIEMLKLQVKLLRSARNG